MQWEKIAKLRIFTQKVLPTVYDDSLSYYELLDKVLYQVNQLTERVNLIPELVNEILNSGIVEQKVYNVLSKYVVIATNPPSGLKACVPDWSKTNKTPTDNAEAIQALLEYCDARGGLILYFPRGDYYVQSTILLNREQCDESKPLFVNTILGASRETTRILTDQNVPVLGGVGQSTTISRLTFEVLYNEICKVMPDCTVIDALLDNVHFSDCVVRGGTYNLKTAGSFVDSKGENTFDSVVFDDAQNVAIINGCVTKTLFRDCIVKQGEHATTPQTAVSLTRQTVIENILVKGDWTTGISFGANASGSKVEGGYIQSAYMFDASGAVSNLDIEGVQGVILYKVFENVANVSNSTVNARALSSAPGGKTLDFVDASQTNNITCYVSGVNPNWAIINPTVKLSSDSYRNEYVKYVTEDDDHTEEEYYFTTNNKTYHVDATLYQFTDALMQYGDAISLRDEEHQAEKYEGMYGVEIINNDGEHRYLLTAVDLDKIRELFESGGGNNTHIYADWVNFNEYKENGGYASDDATWEAILADDAINGTTIYFDGGKTYNFTEQMVVDKSLRILGGGTTPLRRAIFNFSLEKNASVFNPNIKTVYPIGIYVNAQNVTIENIFFYMPVVTGSMSAVYFSTLNGIIYYNTGVSGKQIVKDCVFNGNSVYEELNKAYQIHAIKGTACRNEIVGCTFQAGAYLCYQGMIGLSGASTYPSPWDSKWNQVGWSATKTEGDYNVYIHDCVFEKITGGALDEFQSVFDFQQLISVTVRDCRIIIADGLNGEENQLYVFAPQKVESFLVENTLIEGSGAPVGDKMSVHTMAFRQCVFKDCQKNLKNVYGYFGEAKPSYTYSGVIRAFFEGCRIIDTVDRSYYPSYDKTGGFYPYIQFLATDVMKIEGCEGFTLINGADTYMTGASHSGYANGGTYFQYGKGLYNLTEDEKTKLFSLATGATDTNAEVNIQNGFVDWTIAFNPGTITPGSTVQFIIPARLMPELGSSANYTYRHLVYCPETRKVCGHLESWIYCNEQGTTANANTTSPYYRITLRITEDGQDNGTWKRLYFHMFGANVPGSNKVQEVVIK